MSEPISAGTSHLLQQVLENQKLQQQQQQQPATSGKGSFENVLKQTNEKQAIEKTDKTQQLSDAEKAQKLQEMQKELTNSYDVSKSNQTNMNDMMSNFFKNGTRLDYLMDANRNLGSTKGTKDIAGQLMNIEREHFSIENLMHSNKELSQGELLALQARLYKVSQHIEVMSKVVDQMAGGIKTVLNTNV